MSDAQREREYSPSSAIGGNYQPFIAAYQNSSAAARVQAERAGGQWHACRYGSAAAEQLQLCLPRASGRPAALLVFIHGGYWQELSAEDSLFAATACIEHGHAFAALDYTLAPAATLPQIVDECRQALAWLKAEAGALGVDALRIVVAGSSAGAHLAAMVALHAASRPSALVLVSGIYELEPLIGTTINHALGLDVATARAQSPALHSLAGFPRALVAWGAVETAAFKQQSLQLAAALRAAGRPVSDFEVPRRNHFDVILDLADEHTALGRHTLALLQGS